MTRLDYFLGEFHGFERLVLEFALFCAFMFALGGVAFCIGRLHERFLEGPSRRRRWVEVNKMLAEHEAMKRATPGTTPAKGSDARGARERDS